MGAVVGQHRIDLVGTAATRCRRKSEAVLRATLLVQFHKRELGRAVDRHQQIEPALPGSDFNGVDVKDADRVGLDIALDRSLALDLRQMRNAMPLQATVT